MCPSPPRDLRERDCKHKRYGIEVLGMVWLETNVLILRVSPQGLLPSVSRGVRQIWHYNSFRQLP